MKNVIRWVGCGVLIAALSLASLKSAQAQSSQSGNLDFGTDKALIVAGAVAIAVVVTAVIVHRNSGKRSITGCVNAGANGIGLTSDNDKKFYAFTGDTTGIKSGDRITLKVKKIKTSGSSSLSWQPQKVIADLGPCQP